MNYESWLLIFAYPVTHCCIIIRIVMMVLIIVLLIILSIIKCNVYIIHIVLIPLWWFMIHLPSGVHIQVGCPQFDGWYRWALTNWAIIQRGNGLVDISRQHKFVLKSCYMTTTKLIVCKYRKHVNVNHINVDMQWWKTPMSIIYVYVYVWFCITQSIDNIDQCQQTFHP